MVADGFGRPGFPNIFSPTAAQSLGYAAAMLEAGVQVVYLYVADAHDRNPLPVDPNTGRAAPPHAFGPGEQEYVNQLKAYDQAFGSFFARLASAGINKNNTLFFAVPDENDHFVGSQPVPANCDGVHVPCTYAQASEINASLNRLLRRERLADVTTRALGIAASPQHCQVQQGAPGQQLVALRSGHFDDIFEIVTRRFEVTQLVMRLAARVAQLSGCRDIQLRWPR